MTVLPRNLLIGSFLMVAALVAASCSSSETGQTLSVTAVPNSPQQVQTGKNVDGNPIVNYKGRKELLFNWSLIQPDGGQGIIVSGAASKAPVFNFVKPGDYKVALNVQEDGGNISETDSGIYRVVAGPMVASGPDVSVGVTNLPTPFPSQTLQGTATVNITGGIPPYTINWDLTPNTPSGSVTAFSFPASVTQTSTNSASRIFTFTTQGSGTQLGTYQIRGNVTDSAGAPSASFQINVSILFTNPS